MNHEMDRLPREELRAIQNERLAETVRTAYESVDFYRKRLTNAGVTPDTIDTVEDLTDVPFTTSSDIRETYPDGLLTVPLDQLQRVHSSSGTTGKAKIFGYTQADLDRWRRLLARSLRTAGFDPQQTVQNACKYGMVSGGLGWHDGLEQLGVTLVPSAVAPPERQIELIRDLDVDGLICFPSFALDLADIIDTHGGDPAELPVSTVTVGGEPTSRALREEIADRLDVVVTEHYGLSELFGGGIATECAAARDGVHVWEDQFYVEIVDPETGRRVPEGQEGELVLTSLTKEAMPLLRYRTGDTASMTTEVCSCGRTHLRVSVTERRRNALSIGDTTVYPTAIEHELLTVPETAPYYRIDLRDAPGGDELQITIERRRDQPIDRDAVADRLRQRLREELSLPSAEVTIVDPGSVDRPLGEKATRVYDHRS